MFLDIAKIHENPSILVLKMGPTFKPLIIDDYYCFDY